MFLLKSNFKKDILILLISSILLGTILVIGGAYLTDNYFANMVSGLIGEYGEYDLLFTLASDKEDIALKQIENVVNNTLVGSKFKVGPKVVGSSNYLLKLPEEFKNEETYTNIDQYFADIPGLMSKTMMTEPRLVLRGFRGDTLPLIRPLIEGIEGIDFIYAAGDGLDIIVKKPELVPQVKRSIDNILDRYNLLEIRYPLNQHPENLLQVSGEIMGLITDGLDSVQDVSKNSESDRISLLTSLKQMKDFLISYATKIVISLPENSEGIPIGSHLFAQNEDGSPIVLKLIANKDQGLVALIQEGNLNGTTLDSLEVYLKKEDGTRGQIIGKGEINNPRQDLATALEKLNEITPNLNGFLDLSEQLVAYSERINADLTNINQGLNQLEMTSQKLSSSLQEWQQEGLSLFLKELLDILVELKNNIGDINDIQHDLVKTSNQLKEGASLIEEKLIYVPRNNSIYRQLNELKNLFLQFSTGLDNNYDLVTERLANMDPILNSIDDWQEKIYSLIKVEDTLNSGADWQKVETIINKIDETTQIIDTRELQEKLKSIQDLLIELKTTQLPAVLNQLSYIQNSLPDLKEAEIVETINLIDSYLAGQVIPGDQIQLLLQGKYNSKELFAKVKSVIKNPTVSIIEMDAGIMQPNPRGELFNILSQVRAVISIIIAFIFTLLTMILDQTLIISMIRLNQGKAYLYGFLSGGLIFSLICFLSQINFPYLNFKLDFLIGGILGLIIAFLAAMLNPVNQEEWEAGKSLGFSSAEIMHEIIIPAGKPGFLYLLNYPRIIFK